MHHIKVFSDYATDTQPYPDIVTSGNHFVRKVALTNQQQGQKYSLEQSHTILCDNVVSVIC